MYLRYDSYAGLCNQLNWQAFFPSWLACCLHVHSTWLGGLTKGPYCYLSSNRTGFALRCLHSCCGVCLLPCLCSHVTGLTLAQALGVDAVVLPPAWSRTADSFNRSRLDQTWFKDNPVSTLLDVEAMAANWSQRGIQLLQASLAACCIAVLQRSLGAGQTRAWASMGGRCIFNRHGRTLVVSPHPTALCLWGYGLDTLTSRHVACLCAGNDRLART